MEGEGVQSVQITLRVRHDKDEGELMLQNMPGTIVMVVPTTGTVREIKRILIETYGLQITDTIRRYIFQDATAELISIIYARENELPDGTKIGEVCRKPGGKYVMDLWSRGLRHYHDSDK